MSDPLLPLRFLLLVFAGLVNREQANVVEFLREENRVLREQPGKRRLRLTDAQRARLSSRAKAVGRSALAAIARIPKTHRYRLTTDGLRGSLFFTRTYARLLRPALSRPTLHGLRTTPRRDLLGTALSRLDASFDHLVQLCHLGVA